jgi:hypothetical protein
MTERITADWPDGANDARISAPIRKVGGYPILDVRVARFAKALAAAVVVGASACTGSPVKVCTLIGCGGGLTVVLDGAGASRATSVEVSGPGDSTRVQACNTATPCTGTQGVFFYDFTPDTATIRVVTDSGATTFTTAPAYTVTYPNGKACGPECRSATVHVSIPG